MGLLKWVWRFFLHIYWDISMLNFLTFKSFYILFKTKYKKNLNTIVKTKNWLLIAIRPESSDKWELRIIMSWLEYWILKEKQIYNFLKEDFIFIDAWANIGLFTLYISKLFDIKKWILIEPITPNLNILRTNIGLNNIKNLKIYENALYKNDVSINMDINQPFDWIKIDNNWTYSVNGISLKTIFDKEQILNLSLLKIDIEWWEWFLLNNENLQYFAKIKIIILEYHLFNKDNTYSQLESYFSEIFFIKRVNFNKFWWVILLINKKIIQFKNS